ncbi:hypothetical protein B0H17DRAFT_1203764 [Mycena rosella]|uniref:Uncharacterized protein n=1 Tax=Mycena rosella TaxID=1033263 RepID=A0AAD7DB48_MYCRO|nr:hypothetical protein B0H17DRAFT_1203764 [Mycena rosella]
MAPIQSKLHESLWHIITVEIKTGQLNGGKLAEAAEHFFKRQYIHRAGWPCIAVRLPGSTVRFFIGPDMLQNAPMQVA